MKKVVVKVSMNAGDKRRSPCKSILINLAKLMVPWEFLWEKSTPTAAKNRTKAMKVAASLPGVQETGLEGEEKDRLVVKGDNDFDPIKLVRKLRKKVASAEIVSLVDPEKKAEKKNDPPVIYPYTYYGVPANLKLMEISEPSPFCSIL